MKAVVPVSENDLAAPLKTYKAYVDQGLATLVTQTRQLSDDISGNHLAKARTDWLTAHRTYSSLGAAYGTFEDFDQKINGRADGLAGESGTRTSPGSIASSTGCGTGSRRAS